MVQNDKDKPNGVNGKAAPRDDENPVRRCPSCGREGRAREMFGSRTVRGVTVWQPWCKDCRAKPK